MCTLWLSRSHFCEFDEVGSARSAPKCSKSVPKCSKVFQKCSEVFQKCQKCSKSALAAPPLIKSEPPGDKVLKCSAVDSRNTFEGDQKSTFPRVPSTFGGPKCLELEEKCFSGSAKALFLEYEALSFFKSASHSRKGAFALPKKHFSSSSKHFEVAKVLGTRGNVLFCFPSKVLPKPPTEHFSTLALLARVL